VDEFDQPAKPPPTEQSDPLLTIPEAANLFSVSERTVKRWIERRYLKVVRLPSGRLKVKTSEAKRLLEEIPANPKGDPLLTLSEAAELAKTSYEMMRALVVDKCLKAIRLPSGIWGIRTSELQKRFGLELISQ
jgi:excisionase family DNA binding protein